MKEKYFFRGVCTVIFLLVPDIVLAVPGIISYQGKLSDFDGIPVEDRTYTIQFRIYDVALGGSALWSEIQSVPVTGGVYNVSLGSVSPIPPGILENPVLYLGVQVEADSEMTPRQEITSCFYALKAGDADSISGQEISDLDDTYVNENQADSITSSMIVDSTIGSSDLGVDSVGASEIESGAVGGDEIADNSVTASDLQDGAALAEILDDDGSGSLLDADFIDGHDAADFILSGGDYGRSGVADNLYEGTSTLSSRYVNEDQADSITGSMIVDETINSADILNDSLKAVDLAPNSVGSSEIAPGSVGESEIAWSIDYIGNNTNGGLISLTNTSDGSFDNYPAGIFGAADGSSRDGGVFGVFGSTPALDHNLALKYLPHEQISVAGVSSEGLGVAGVSYSGSGVYAFSIHGDGLYSHTDASDRHAGSFYSGKGTGLGGSALYAGINNSTGFGIAFWAHNANSASTDATTVLSNDGSGPLLKGFGGNGGEEEFRFDNDGTLHFYNSDHTESIRIEPSEYSLDEGGQIIFHNDSGNVTVEVDGDYNNYGRIDLRDEDAELRLTLTGSYSSANMCGAVQVKNNSGVNTVQIIGEYPATGKGRVVTEEIQITGGSDLSEQFDVARNLTPMPGMLVSIDPERPGKLMVSTMPYDRKVVGIISGAGGVDTGLMMGQPGTETSGETPVALSGRVYCLAVASNGAIEPGDLLTSSDVPGYAMKVTDHSRGTGAIVGKAMTSLKEGKGLVLVLTTLQ